MTTCTMTKNQVAGLEVTYCPECREVEWWEGESLLDPDEGMARLFGRFDLVGRLPALGAPGPEVLVYQPPARQARGRLAAFPRGVWLEAAPDLWLSHDGERLLLCPSRPLLLDNLAR